jgi:imidazolonepropionase
MTPAEAITAATLNAAYSLGRGHEIGSLEPGKQADFAIHDRSDYREIPYFFGVPTVQAVYMSALSVFIGVDRRPDCFLQHSTGTALTGDS